ncbi:hypothetical protein BCBD1442_05460 [Brucella ceti]|nr:hypothetical protein BCBD1442_05460 [Brucella ceti]
MRRDNKRVTRWIARYDVFPAACVPLEIANSIQQNDRKSALLRGDIHIISNHSVLKWSFYVPDATMARNRAETSFP